jgi:dipeptidyl aminopeptidase/acylaminoacyl peptidase
MKLAVRLILAFGTAGVPASAQIPSPLTLDDLFELEGLASATVSPDGEWVAAVVIRPARPGAVYGRTFYELDVSRADVWLISRRTGERRNLTQGERDASGYWCAKWSPDGRRLAMLSTRPEGAEPRGGDNVRLYVWDREQEGLTRVASRGVMSQTLGGSPLYKVDLRHWHRGTGDSERCSGWENAPFLWLDDTSLLAVMVLPGQVSGLLDAYSRGLRHAAGTLEQLREGTAPTATAVESGGVPPEPLNASLMRIDVAGGRAQEVATVPAYPFEGSLQVSLAPNGRAAAVLAPIAAIRPTDTRRFASPYADWSVEKKLGFLDLAPGSTVRWVESLPESATYILDLLSWSADGAAVAIRARPASTTAAQALFAVSARDLSLSRFSPEGVSASISTSSGEVAANFTVLWTRDRRLLARGVKEDALRPVQREVQAPDRARRPPRADWWLFSPDAPPVNVTAGMTSVPARLTPVGGERYVGIADDELWSVDIRTRSARMLNSQPLPSGAQVIWPRDQHEASELLIAGRGRDGARSLMRVLLREERVCVTSLQLPAPAAQFEAYSPAHALLLLRDQNALGTHLWTADVRENAGARLLSLNEHLAHVAPSGRMLIDYREADGGELKAGVLLPPDYESGSRYPVVVWVYAGAVLRDTTDWSLGIYPPGQYNLHLYAARGYVVLVPSMPLRPRDGENDDFIDLPKGVMSALNRLIELGIADPDRLAVMGQSYGGYSTYALVTYTNRFKAAIAMAGTTNLVSRYGQFDPTARSYDGIEHHKSVSWGLLESGQLGMGMPPWEDLWRYLRNSPIYFVDRVRTPVLLIHGEQDIRGPMTQAEEFFYALYRQGRRARLLRYWGEDHALRLSPANVRDMVEEIFAWLEEHMPEVPETPAAASLPAWR